MNSDEKSSIRLPTVAARNPAIGSPPNAPAMSPPKAMPSSPSESPRRSWTAGIRAAKLPKVVPVIKKTDATATRS